MKKLREDDLALLLPSVREATERVIARLRADGYSPLVFDTLRSPEEALRNAARGKGIISSMHLFACSVDLVCGEHLWSCKVKDKKTGKSPGCRFFTKLGAAAEAEGFTWGGRFTRVDQPHFQGIPVAWQNEMRALGMGEESAAARDALCRKWLERKR